MDRAMSRKALKKARMDPELLTAIQRRAKGVEKMVWMNSRTHDLLRDAYLAAPEPKDRFPVFVHAVVERGLQ